MPLVTALGVALWIGSVLFRNPEVRAAASTARSLEAEWENVGEASSNLDVYIQEPDTLKQVRAVLDAARPGDEVDLHWFEIAFQEDHLEAETTGVEHEGPITVWRGRLANRDFGYCLLVSSDAGIAGIVQRDDVTYVIEPIGAGHSMVVEVVLHVCFEKVPSCPPEHLETVVKPVAQDSKDPEYPIELLLLMPRTSPRAAAYGGGATRDLLERMFEERLHDTFNACFLDVPQTEVSFNVNLELVDYVPEGNTLEVDLAWVTHSLQAAELRGKYHADLVGLLVDGPRHKALVGGLANADDPSPQNTSLAVEMHSALAQFSIEHEIGHCMGMRHDVRECDANAKGEANFGMVLSRVVDGKPTPLGRTVMMGNLSDDEKTIAFLPRAPVFSHPGVDPRTGIRYGLSPQDAKPDKSGVLTEVMTSAADNRTMLLKHASKVSTYAQGHPEGE